MGEFTTPKLHVVKDNKGDYRLQTGKNASVKVCVTGEWRSRPVGRRLFTEPQIRAIRKIHSFGETTYKTIAEIYGCSPVLIRLIVLRSAYADII